MENLDDMMEELEQFYESAGFSDYRKNCLEGKSEEEILELYKNTFQEELLFYERQQEITMALKEVDLKA